MKHEANLAFFVSSEGIIFIDQDFTNRETDYILGRGMQSLEQLRLFMCSWLLCTTKNTCRYKAANLMTNALGCGPATCTVTSAIRDIALLSPGQRCTFAHI